MVYVTDSLFQYRLFVSWEKNRNSRSQWLYGITNLVKISLNFQQNICRRRPATLLKKRRPCRYFSVIFTNFFSVAFYGIPLCDCFWTKVTKLRWVLYVAWCCTSLCYQFTRSAVQNQKQPPEVFYKKAIIKNFGIFSGKHLCWSLFLIKLQAFRTIKKRLQHMCFRLILRNF